ncbi:5'-methylthioadenosine/adenosylhomocysteine nucleosidase [bacterium]|nr:5'-methylthioadenosine/adenosylhomocysteine nucleosidase [bacterium]
MHEEINLLKADLDQDNDLVIGKRHYWSGKLYGKNVVLVFSRWGKVASASTATTLIDRFGVEGIVFTGVAGAADLELEIGDIVISSALIQHDMDVSPLPTFNKFEIPLLGISRFAANNVFIERMQISAKKYVESEIFNEIEPEILEQFDIKKPRVKVGLIASGDHFVADHKIISQLKQELNDLLCVEMEGAAVAQVCFEHDIPFVVTRAISDKANRSAIIDFPCFVSKIACFYSRGMIRRMLLEWEEPNP